MHAPVSGQAHGSAARSAAARRLYIAFYLLQSALPGFFRVSCASGLESLRGLWLAHHDRGVRLAPSPVSAHSAAMPVAGLVTAHSEWVTAHFFPFEPFGFRAEPFALARRSFVRRGLFRALLLLWGQGRTFLRPQALPARVQMALVRVLMLALVHRLSCPYFTPAERLT